MGKLEGKIALITGGSDGMGYGTAEEFIREGAFVFITGRRREQLEKAAAALGDRAAGIVADAGKLADLDRMYAEIREKKGKLDIVFANAGIFPQVPHDQVTEELFDSVFDVNVKGVFFTIQKALPLMDRSGSVILNASFLKDSAIAGMSVYSATKAAVAQPGPQLYGGVEGRGDRA